MMLEIRNQKGNENVTHIVKESGINLDDGALLIIPMLLIVLFLVVEIWPIWIVLDGNFIDIFLKYQVLIEQKDLMTPLML